MDLKLVEKIADAVLYEGYLLYPYRPSAIKNRRRFNFGVVHPRDYGLANDEFFCMQTECLAMGNRRMTLDARVRFLHLTAREGWQEAVEREVNAPDLNVADLLASPRQVNFAFPLNQEAKRAGEISEQETINGSIEIKAHLLAEKSYTSSLNSPRNDENSWDKMASCPTFSEEESYTSSLNSPRNDENSWDKMASCPTFSEEESYTSSLNSPRNDENSRDKMASCPTFSEKIFKITVRIQNLTPLAAALSVSRDEALTRSMVSTHVILAARGGEFVSLLDPAEALREMAGSCRNIGTYPVLVGVEGERDAMLSSPIILYDYPQIAPESAGDLFDGTEIDEMLTLRILTLTEEEKREMRDGDELARRILERTEAMPAEQLMKLHGAARSLRQIEDGVQ